MTPTRLHDLLLTYWPGADLGFCAVWAENVDTADMAVRLGADPATATTCTLRGISRGFHEDPPGDDVGIVLIGRSGTWALALQVQGSDITSPAAMAALSGGGGRAVGIGWHANGGHAVDYAADGAVSPTCSMTGREIDAAWLDAPHTRYLLRPA
ncbi:hypothetical protein ACIBH1_02960 [Nonomuraea sp. NPDC050663]|uniref:hypothetical protein n=1 Tax=Nonomuraea sp. NPDC050663 TaxID=3364370 RepID=UPI003794F569